MSKPKFKTTTGRLTSYALACGDHEVQSCGLFSLTLHQPAPCTGYYIRVDDQSGDRLDEVGPVMTVKAARSAMSMLKRKLKPVYTV